MGQKSHKVESLSSLKEQDGHSSGGANEVMAHLPDWVSCTAISVHFLQFREAGFFMPYAGSSAINRLESHTCKIPLHLALQSGSVRQIGEREGTSSVSGRQSASLSDKWFFDQGC
jgi:hypothetical protein